MQLSSDAKATLTTVSNNWKNKVVVQNQSNTQQNTQSQPDRVWNIPYGNSEAIQYFKDNFKTQADFDSYQNRYITAIKKEKQRRWYKDDGTLRTQQEYDDYNKANEITEEVLGIPPRSLLAIEAEFIQEYIKSGNVMTPQLRSLERGLINTYNHQNRLNTQSQPDRVWDIPYGVESVQYLKDNFKTQADLDSFNNRHVIPLQKEKQRRWYKDDGTLRTQKEYDEYNRLNDITEETLGLKPCRNLLFEEGEFIREYIKSGNVMTPKLQQMEQILISLYDPVTNQPLALINKLQKPFNDMVQQRQQQQNQQQQQQQYYNPRSDPVVQQQNQPLISARQRQYLDTQVFKASLVQNTHDKSAEQLKEMSQQMIQRKVSGIRLQPYKNYQELFNEATEIFRQLEQLQSQLVFNQNTKLTQVDRLQEVLNPLIQRINVMLEKRFVPDLLSTQLNVMGKKYWQIRSSLMQIEGTVQLNTLVKYANFIRIKAASMTQWFMQMPKKYYAIGRRDLHEIQVEHQMLLTKCNAIDQNFQVVQGQNWPWQTNDVLVYVRQQHGVVLGQIRTMVSRAETIGRVNEERKYTMIKQVVDPTIDRLTDVCQNQQQM